ncbi:substrate-binding domain-containing protein [Nonomuraea pusilla]|uniref:Monosaccharide ABC transporter substrate-binding protein, CUT2 family (TC 3.A.1.2.-) n=1 Tax=Nonomuraea pusilla TaxID=46177 RepID=A0A1H7ZNE3_9ACTN|nr:substrate-binding domain-containing protein [Nonomuraea pusilla]SEM59068.1 monosaccharide ABC transporter substrate-binding protein, CUT2 family (TC 3.A.1.2.-) [Nonomuraea pusilla]
MARSTRLTRLAAVTTILATGLLAAACGGSADSGASGGDRPRVGLVQINQQAIFFNEMNAGAQQAAKEANVDLTIFNANDDPAKQNEAIDNFVQQQFDAVIVVAIDVEGIKPAVKIAKDAGLKVVAVDAIVDSPAVDTQVGVDNAAAAKQAGDFVNKWSQEHKLTAPKIGVVGALNSFIQNIRKDDFNKTVEAAGAKIVQTVDGQNKQEAAMTAAENLLTSRSDMNIVYATGEPALLGTVAAVKSQNAADRVKVFGWDLTKEAISGIDAGFVAGVVQQDPKTEGYEAVKEATALAGGAQPKKKIDVPVTIVTKDNVDPYRATFK